ncbi:class D beta-lactamase [Aeromonas aquatica]|uniref:class D beta-lactamase n=1 Tax=Aeromonas aquatica TaxID=558964 RepID=UPI00051C71A4|nr:class D beta-lactamase [Aeromonas aquatica]
MPRILLSGLLAAGLLCSLPASAASGCLLFADGSGKPISTEGDCAAQLPPASTFKIPLALMGYDSGFLVDEQLPALPFKPGDADFLPEWRETTTPSRWMTYSVIWYSQRLTEWLGMARLQQYVDRFDYGNRDLAGNPGKHDGLTQAWLSSSLAISPQEQARFLGKLVSGKLPVSAQTLNHTSAILRQPDIDGWQIHGKTGMGYPKLLDGSLNRDQQIGWFVGWASKQDKKLIFVHTVIQKPGKQFASLKAKEEVFAALPAQLKKM